MPSQTPSELPGNTTQQTTDADTNTSNLENTSVLGLITHAVVWGYNNKYVGAIMDTLAIGTALFITFFLATVVLLAISNAIGTHAVWGVFTLFGATAAYKRRF